jgi:hypothetical protein
MEEVAGDETPGGQAAGTRLVLVGAVVYLLEWVAIIGLSPQGPFGPGEKAATVVSSYAGHAGATATAAGWFSVVLLGRVLVVIGLRSSLRHRRDLRPALDFAVAAMAAGVVLEIASYGLVAGTARVAADGGASDTVVGLDSVAYWLNLLIVGPTGAAVLVAGLVMVRSRAFPMLLSWLPVACGALGILAGVLVTLATEHQDVLDALESPAIIGMWVWMVATGVLLWRRAGIQAARPAASQT